MIYIEAFNEIEKTTSRGELSSNSSFAYYKIKKKGIFSDPIYGSKVYKGIHKDKIL